MCVEGCQETVMRRLTRRGLLKGTAVAVAGASTATALPAPASAQTSARAFTHAIDLTHTLFEDFPTYFGSPQLEIEPVFTFSEHGFNVNRWHMGEHVGTHLDAPIHFSADGPSADMLSAGELVVPLAVVDIKEKVSDNPDAQVTPDDLDAWIAAHGPLPQGGAVAMNSGWAQFANDAQFRNADADGVMHFPGFHEDAAHMMMEAGVVGMLVDTLSLDIGPSQDFATHYVWLPSGRWGVECVANLDAVPANGATLVLGAPKIRGATGGPSRIFALV